MDKEFITTENVQTSFNNTQNAQMRLTLDQYLKKKTFPEPTNGPQKGENKTFPVGIGTRSNAPNNKVRIPNLPRQYQSRQANQII